MQARDNPASSTGTQPGVPAESAGVPRALLRIRRFITFFFPKEAHQWLFAVAITLFVFGLYRGVINDRIDSLLGYNLYSNLSVNADPSSVTGVDVPVSAFYGADNSAPVYFAVILLILAGILRADFKFEERKRRLIEGPADEDAKHLLLRLLEDAAGKRRKVQSYICALLVPAWLTLIYVAMNLDGLPLFLAEFSATISRMDNASDPLSDPRIGMAVLSIVVAILTITVISILYFMVMVPIRDLAREIKKTSDEIEFEQTRTDEGRHNFLRRKLQQLTTRSAQVFLDGASSERQRQVAELRAEATRLLDVDDSQSNANLNEAQFVLTTAEELILREEAELAGQRNWQYFAIGIVIVYFAGLIWAITYLSAENRGDTIPGLQIPYAIILWSAFGGLAAVLYRFYTETTRVRFEAELRWLLARPLIGVIMGAITYLALASGLVLFGAEPEPSTTQNQIYWLVAFVAGFSDRFYMTIIDLVVGKFVVEDKQVHEVKVKQTTSVVNKTSELADA